MNMQNQLLLFIGEELLDEDDAIDAHENLLADGMIDSLGMMRLVAFIETQYDVKIPPQDFTIENFRTVALIDRYVQKLLGNS